MTVWAGRLVRTQGQDSNSEFYQCYWTKLHGQFSEDGSIIGTEDALRGTEDALHCARRAVERAWAERGGSLHLMALDWQKAFDSINTESMLNALCRFGLPSHFCSVIKSIYTDRRFEVRESKVTSERERQDSGICQGWPFSPFLFITVMSLLMHDAKELMPSDCRDACNANLLFDLLYTDRLVETFALAVERAGATYGMTLHWGKTQALSVGTTSKLRRPDGTDFDEASSLQYLGGLICADGRADSEVSRKIGCAKSAFNRLQKVWSHSGVTLKQKLLFLDGCVMAKLRHGLASLWLVTAQRRRLDGFQARCLRRLLHIPAAFVSRISNKEVFKRADVRPLSEQLLKHQLLLLRKVAISTVGGPLRRDSFVGATTQPQIGRFVRRIGRPRQDWTSQLLCEGNQLMGTLQFQAFLSDNSDGANARWKAEVEKLF